MRCPRCGNDNPETNRFCGMCGASLLQGPAATTAQAGSSATTPPASAGGTKAGGAAPAGPGSGMAASASASAPAAPSAPAARSDEGPIISGPSILGLNQPAPSARRRATLSLDPHAGPSAGNLDYLLEDEEEPKRGGAGKFVLIVIVLALAAGFGYVRWKGVPWLGAGAAKPSVASQAPEAANTNSAVPASSVGAAAPGANQPTAGASPSATEPTAASPSTAPATSIPVPSSAAPSSAPNAGGTGAGSSSAAAAEPAAGKNASAAASGATAAVSPTPAPVPAQPAAKPRASAPARAFDPVAEAQKYIYGKRAPQDCDRGLRLLKPAADQANPKAMIEMGALYSAGLCTPRDLPTAYRWFALALRKDPNNQPLQADLNKLWGEMTQPERQLAIKLSQ